MIRYQYAVLASMKSHSLANAGNLACMVGTFSDATFHFSPNNNTVDVKFFLYNHDVESEPTAYLDAAIVSLKRMGAEINSIMLYAYKDGKTVSRKSVAVT